jgi:hypothetical protein
MQKEIVSNIVKSVMHFFKKNITQLNQEIKFSQRESKLTAELFFETLIMGCFFDEQMSLERMCRLLKKRKVSITKQGLSERFSQSSTNLMSRAFEQSLKQFKTKHPSFIDLLKPFTSIKILDSSGIELPSELKNLYRGFGGGASESALKLQVMLNYIEGQIEQVTLTHACKNDQSFTGHLDEIEKSALYLQDLGYFKTESFEKIAKGDAYFITRYLSQTKMFDEESKEINLCKILKKEKHFLSKNFLMGSKTKLKVRLIAQRLPKSEADKRAMKVKKETQRKGYTAKKETLELAKWSIYLTNVPEELLSDEEIHLAYTLRWQIELFFKLGKSEIGLDKMNGKKSDRILSELYAKLICIVIFFYITFPVRWQGVQELSFTKAYKQLKQRCSEFFKAITSKYLFKKFLEEFWEDLKGFAMKDKYHKKRRATHQKLMDAANQGALA